MNLFQKLEKFPDPMTTEHLIELGLYKTREHAYFLRKKGYCPEHIYINPKKIVYTKKAVYEFLKDKTRVFRPGTYKTTWLLTDVLDGKSEVDKKPFITRFQEVYWMKQNGFSDEEIERVWEGECPIK